MNDTLKEYLFSKYVLVSNDVPDSKDSFFAVFTLSNLLSVRVTEGQELATLDVVKYAAEQFGIDVPAPFYRNFPESVKALTREELVLDQLLHYVSTYGFGNFDTPEHSLFEKDFERTAFHENTVIRDFKIVNEEDAKNILFEYVDGMFKSSRPLNANMYTIAKLCIDTLGYEVKECKSKSNAIRLLYDTKNVAYANLLKLPDVIALVDYINYNQYKNTDIRALNLRNQDRKFVTRVLDRLLETATTNQARSCFENRAVWCGLLHHLHYTPKGNREEDNFASRFVTAIRDKKYSGLGVSVLSEFERLMNSSCDPVRAALYLARNKGAGAVLRNLNYILSRCKTEKEVGGVLDCLKDANPIILIQLMIQYKNYREDGARVFKFVKHSRLMKHTETSKELSSRRSFVNESVREAAEERLRDLVKAALAGKVGKTYIDPAMYKIAVPLQMATGEGGFGILPTGSRLGMPEWKKLRAFTYWEKVNDIDLSCLGLADDGSQVEFSWRSWGAFQSKGITFSGDETSGYNGGSEYFDIDLEAFKASYPNVHYIVFENNIYTSGVKFSECVCRAGYMLRDVEDSGMVYEPKTVKSAYAINGDVNECHLFALDLAKNEFVWLNIADGENRNVAGVSSKDFLVGYLNITDVINLGSLFEMMSTELVEKPEDADVILSDNAEDIVEDPEREVQIIRSCDFEKVFRYLNK